MTQPNTEAQDKDTTLDEVLFELANYAHGVGAASGYGVFVGGEPQEKAKQALLQWRDKAVVEQLRKDRLANAKFWKSNIDIMFDREIEVYKTALKETPNED